MSNAPEMTAKWNPVICGFPRTSAAGRKGALALASGSALRSRAAEIPLPTIPDALRFRSDQMGWNDSMMAGKLGMGRSHYSEVLSGKRPLPLSAIRKAYALGVPASVLLQPNIKVSNAGANPPS